MVTLAIDPGIGGTGWARFHAGEFLSCGTLHPTEEGVEWMVKAESLCNRFIDLLAGTEKLGALVIEGPVFMRGVGGYTTASTGDLCKLAMLTGMLINCFNTMNAGVVKLVEPSKWKGQLPKSVCKTRILKILSKDNFVGRISNHAFDAVGIGLWHFGKF